jgi:hypothetical protein
VPDLSVLLSLTAGGTLKIWRISPACKEQVVWEEESKQLRLCKHPLKPRIINSMNKKIVLRNQNKKK